MAEGWEAVEFHQSLQETKNLASRPFILEVKVQSPKVVAIYNAYFLTKVTDSGRKFGSDGNGNPNSGQDAVGFVFHKKVKDLQDLGR